ncbi:Transcriptional regulator, AraC family [Methanosarcina sp. WWM596]|nr:Transcriptional regulator, AraC family [Methanosarcina sp. WWM596]AKB21743.1 Transcriptional regulator, AraC family [Methanosarcina sp. WH1]
MEIVEDRIVRDGNIWTSAGTSVGIGLALVFVEYMAYEKTAGKI